MSIPTPFHDRTSRCCKSLLYKEWAGYYAVRAYDTYPEREYFALRHTAGLIDVTPLFKYEVTGRDAAAFLSHVMVRDIGKLKVGRVVYTCWCDEAGKMVDDGTVARLDEGRYRVTSADPSLAWFHRCARGFDVSIADRTADVAALSLQGPNARDILRNAAGDDVCGLRYFAVGDARIDGAAVQVSRTGYTGDLGYEIWVKNDDAPRVWDAVIDAGRDHGLLPAGLDAMDVTRIEAGYILNGVDYFNANRCAIESRKSTPFELGLGWLVKLKRRRFIGSDALAEEKRRGPRRVLVCLDIDWDEYERLFEAWRLPPEVHAGAWRTPVPVYDDAGRQVGYATSGTWSPILKKNLALATVEPHLAALGSPVRFEVTVEYERKAVRATVTEKPAFDPERKRS